MLEIALANSGLRRAAFEGPFPRLLVLLNSPDVVVPATPKPLSSDQVYNEKSIKSFSLILVLSDSIPLLLLLMTSCSITYSMRLPKVNRHITIRYWSQWSHSFSIGSSHRYTFRQMDRQSLQPAPALQAALLVEWTAGMLLQGECVFSCFFLARMAQ